MTPLVYALCGVLGWTVGGITGSWTRGFILAGLFSAATLWLRPAQVPSDLLLIPTSLIFYSAIYSKGYGFEISTVRGHADEFKNWLAVAKVGLFYGLCNMSILVFSNNHIITNCLYSVFLAVTGWLYAIGISFFDRQLRATKWGSKVDWWKVSEGIVGAFVGWGVSQVVR